MMKSGHIYFPKTLIGTLTGMGTGSAYQRLSGVLFKLVADQKLETISTKEVLASGTKVPANTKELYRIKPTDDFEVYE